jgi:hypothetical protein
MQNFSVNGQLQRNHEVQKKARKSLGPDISSPQAVNDNNIPSRPSERCQNCLSQASTSRALHSEKRHFSLCADSSFNCPQSLPGSQSPKPFLGHPSHHGYWACERTGVGERRSWEGGQKRRREWWERPQRKIRVRPDATPRHGVSRASSAHKRCAPQMLTLSNQKPRIPEKCELELSHSPSQNTQFPNECEELEVADWSAQLIHKKNPNSSHTGPPTALLSASGKLPKFHASLDTGTKLSSHAIGGSTHASLQVLVGP